MLLCNCLESFSLLNDNFHACMQALGYILIAKPEFMLQDDILNLIQSSLSSDGDCRLKV